MTHTPYHNQATYDACTPLDGEAVHPDGHLRCDECDYFTDHESHAEGEPCPECLADTRPADQINPPGHMRWVPCECDAADYAYEEDY